MSAKVRINRYLAAAGFGSRRKCEDLIRQGLVSINGEAIERLATIVDPDVDSVAVDGRAVRRAVPAKVFILNKPVGVLSTVSDSFDRRTVIDLVREHGIMERLFPVGRLDLDTSGLLILTNDGDLAYRLTHPRFKIEKTYRVTVEGRVTKETASRIAGGVDLGGYTTKPCTVAIVGRGEDSTTLEVRLMEGRKRQIRRMFARFGHRTVELRRTALGDLSFSDVAPGRMRALTEIEERRLRELAGLSREGEETASWR
ncbi:MAG: pseudouridine synthase [Candidatus Krumholzibacteriaceae bacterium]|jgi:pseudouridine synthase